MRSKLGLVIIALASTAGVSVAADGPPIWAYGTPPAPAGNTAANPAGRGGRGGAAPPPAADDGVQKHLPDSSGAFTVTQIRDAFGPADWYPGDHPAMPDIVAHGRK